MIHPTEQIRPIFTENYETVIQKKATRIAVATGTAAAVSATAIALIAKKTIIAGFCLASAVPPAGLIVLCVATVVLALTQSTKPTRPIITHQNKSIRDTKLAYKRDS